MSRCICFVLFTIAFIEIAKCKFKNYENFDPETVLGNPARSKKFFECVKKDHACSKDDRELKLDLIEMITTNCKSCTAKEKVKLEAIKGRAVSDPNIMKLAMGDHAM